MMKDFSILPQNLQDALKLQNITEPTPIQAQAIEPAMQGNDVLGTAQTGTGKTYAFLLPILTRMETDPAAGDALVLAPTRELAQQIFEALKLLKSGDKNFHAALVIGGDNIQKQFADLRKKPRFIIATPGRVIDHMGRKSINLKNVRFWVLDETDRMLDMGFIQDMRRIGSALPEPRQTLMFSATMPKEITDLAAQFLKNPVRIKIGSVTSTIDLVSQEIICLGVREKLTQLVHELNTRQGSVLIFVKTKHGAERLAKQLKMYGVKVNALHGDLRQNRRKQVLDAFRDESVRVLVATDVAARGIDVPHIAHVINYDLPQQAEDYIHRIGRTGRAGSVGCAVSFIAGDEDKWREISDVTQFGSPVKMVEKTAEPLPAPKFVPQEEPRRAAAKPVKGKGKGRGRRERVIPSTVEGMIEDEAREAERLARAEMFGGKPRTFHKAADAGHVLSESELAERIRKSREAYEAARKNKRPGDKTEKPAREEHAAERARRAEATERRLQKTQDKKGNDVKETKHAPSVSKHHRREQDSARFAKNRRNGQDKRSGSRGVKVTSSRTADGVKIIRVGASKSALRKRLDTTVETVKRKLRRLKQSGFSKFFKKRK